MDETFLSVPDTFLNVWIKMVVVKISNIGQREARAIFGVAKWPELARMHSTEMSSCIPDLYSSAVMDCARVSNVGLGPGDPT